jgi:tetratricopeptide (TPR) repeat protein
LWFNLGNLQTKRAEIQDAEKSYSQTSQIDSLMPQGRACFGNVQLKQERIEMAAECYQQAIELYD